MIKDLNLSEKILIQMGHINKAQAAELVEFAEKRGLGVRDAAVQMRIVDIETATQALARSRGVPYIDLDETIPDEEILDQFPQQVAKRNTILPLFIDENVLLVACADQPTHDLEDELRLRFQVPSRWVLATPKSIRNGIIKYYAAREEREDIDQDVTSSTEDSSKKSPAKKTKTENKPKERKRSQGAPQLSPDALKEKKQLAFIFSGWAFCGAILLDQFVLKNYVFSQTWSYNFVLTTIVTPIIVFYLWSGMWKK